MTPCVYTGLSVCRTLMGQHPMSQWEKITYGASRALWPAASWVPWAATGHACLNKGFFLEAHLGSLITTFPVLTSFTSVSDVIAHSQLCAAGTSSS